MLVRNESAGFRVLGDHVLYFPEEQGFMSHNERHFLPRAIRDLAPSNLASIPVVVDAGDVKLAITDADVDDYPGLWLRGTGASGLDAVFPPVALEEQRKNDRDVFVTKTADYIAKTTGTRSFPWRAVAIAKRDADLLTNPLVYLLAKPSQIADTSWIKPGKVAWDWWNANNVSGVDFVSGVNTATYKHFIDFAAAHGLQYIVLDEGWYKLGDVLQVVPEIDMDALMAHAREKNVGVILWVVWKSLEDQLDVALDRWQKWGVKGLKIDFMQRDDQAVINFYHRVNREAAKRKMLTDYHGGIRSVLMTRTWPNLINVEGVRGMEWSKWSAHTHPEHDVTLPFTRMFLGPMDYTPGAMVNAARGSFAPLFSRPMSQGTRCHQLAMYVVFEAPLQMLADSPTNYAREPDAMAFLSAVPTTWDETRALDGRIADYVVVARRSGADWYVGAMTDWTARDLEVDLSFLPAGKYTLESWEDGLNANRRGEDTRRRTSPGDERDEGQGAPRRRRRVGGADHARAMSAQRPAWILDSGGAGRGAWQGGVLYELMRWARQHGGYPQVMMGASAGGYAAADVATGTEQTVLKGWSVWGDEAIPAGFRCRRRLRRDGREAGSGGTCTPQFVT